MRLPSRGVCLFAQLARSNLTHTTTRGVVFVPTRLGRSVLERGYVLASPLRGASAGFTAPALQVERRAVLRVSPTGLEWASDRVLAAIGAIAALVADCTIEVDPSTLRRSYRRAILKLHGTFSFRHVHKVAGLNVRSRLNVR